MTILLFLSFVDLSVNAADLKKKSTTTLKIIKTGSENIFKSLINKSIVDDEILNFLSEFVVTFDDDRGDGLVTYYFDDNIYKRYKNFELISMDNWTISKLDKKLKVFNGTNKFTWKIQAGKNNTIVIREKIYTPGKSYNFLWKFKTDYHVGLEEKKLKDKN